MPKLDSVTVSLNFGPFGGISGTWKPNDVERKAAWELYVELVSRVSVVKLPEDQGILREGLNSLYSVFQSTREILRRYGPDVAPPRKNGGLSLGRMALMVLNFQLRPLLTKWHPVLLEYEDQRKAGTSVKKHEDIWGRAKELRADIDATRKVLVEYSVQLSKIAQIEPLHEAR